MRLVYGVAVTIGAVSLGLVSSAQTPAADRFWPQWRGPHANGISRHANPPIEWSETKNVRWKVEIPGRGSSSPVVWGDRVFVMTAIPAGTSMAESHGPRGGVNPRAVHR